MSLTPSSVVRWIASTLRWGCYLSALFLLAGLTGVLTGPDVPLQVGPPMSLEVLGRQLLGRNPYAVMQLGILLLLLTPLVRIVAAAVSFELAGERRYALVALAVLVFLLLTLAGLA